MMSKNLGPGRQKLSFSGEWMKRKAKTSFKTFCILIFHPVEFPPPPPGKLRESRRNMTLSTKKLKKHYYQNSE